MQRSFQRLLPSLIFSLVCACYLVPARMLQAETLSSNSSLDLWAEEASSPGGDFREFDFSGDRFATKGAELNLNGADLTGATFAGTFFDTEIGPGSGVEAKISFEKATLSGADFAGANFTFFTGNGSDNRSVVGFREARMDNVSFSGARFVSFTGGEERNLSKADFQGARLNNADFTRTTFFLFVPEGKGNRATIDFRSASLAFSDFSEAMFTTIVSDNDNQTVIDFAGADLEGADFSNTRFENNGGRPGERSLFNFTGATLIDVSFRGATIVSSPFLDIPLFDFTGADLSGAILVDLDLGAVKFDRTSYSINTVFPAEFRPEVEPGLVPVFDEVPMLQPISSIEITATGARLAMPRLLWETVGVEYSRDLRENSWLELGNFFPDGRDAVFVDPDFVRLGRRKGFYRAFQRAPVE